MNMRSKLLAGKAELAVVGLGYVGMPLTLAFAEKVKVIGYDLSEKKIRMYKSGIDPTLEVGDEALKNTSAEFTNEARQLRRADFIIAAVPTPVDGANNPDLKCVVSACETIGQNMKSGVTVVFESTVYPGVTEDICIPILERESGLKCGVDFKVGYSPERINPGDKVHKLENIVKIVSGIDPETTGEIAGVYDIVVNAGTFKAKSIKAAEAAKLVENAQRDVNIAFMNEMSIIFDRIGIDSIDVINAMNTKWNALNFSPGLVGGHCISVDPYYLIQKAEITGYHSLVVHSCRNVNDTMGVYIADSAARQMMKANQNIKAAKVYVMGITYKENCPDIRNSMVYKIIKRFEEYKIDSIVVDPFADKDEVLREFGVRLTDIGEIKDATCMLFAVAHDQFKRFDVQQLDKMFLKTPGISPVVVDIRNIFERDEMEAGGYVYWNL